MTKKHLVDSETKRFAKLERAASWHEFQFQIARQRGDDDAAIVHHNEMTACRLALAGVTAVA